MRRFSLALAVASFMIASSASAVTDKHVQGVITAVDATHITIAGKHVVTGTVDPKARIVLDGHKASLADLKVTFSARADMNLDDAWIQIEASR
ncbi:MAG TPA: hypothetical protein VF407_18415, partial [Polyangiaceae bacterium]